MDLNPATSQFGAKRMKRRIYTHVISKGEEDWEEETTYPLGWGGGSLVTPI